MGFGNEWKKFLKRLKQLLESASEEPTDPEDTSPTEEGTDSTPPPDAPHDQPDSSDSPGPEPGPDGHSEPQKFNFEPMAAGEVTMDTRGIAHQNDRNEDGGWEFIFLTLHGEGFDRVILFHAGGGGRKVRFKVGTNRMQMGVASDDLPDWHTWSIKWGNGTMRFYLDGNPIGRDEPFDGKVDLAIAGGYDDTHRNFKGTWRNFTRRGC